MCFQLRILDVTEVLVLKYCPLCLNITSKSETVIVPQSSNCNRASIHGRKTRNCDQLQIPLYTSAAGQRSFKFRGAKIWNSLDTDLKEHKSLKNFKLALKSRLFSNLYK